MPADLVEQLRQLAESFDEFVGEVTTDEIVWQRDTVSDGLESSPPARPRRGSAARRMLVGAAASVLIAGLVGIAQLRQADGPPTRGGQTALADALVGHRWVAIDFPSAVLPWVQFSRGDGSTSLEVHGTDGCNQQEGRLGLDGQQVIDSRIASTAIACSGPSIGPLLDGSVLDVTSGELVVTGPDGSATRYVALDALPELLPDELVGTYTVGTTPLTITADAVVTEDCSRTWTGQDDDLVFTGPPCSPPPSPAYVLLAADRWEAAAGDAQHVVVTVGERYVRLDRTPLDAPNRPGLASFLGAAGDRTWVFDAPLAEYPLARRPSLRLPTEWTGDGDLLVSGFDGCTTYSANGSWTPSGTGWAATITDGESTTVDCRGDRRTVAVSHGYTLSLTAEGMLAITDDTGNQVVMRDIRAATWAADLPQSPIAAMSGEWELDPGVTLEITQPAEPAGRGTIRAIDCVVEWWSVGNEWIAAGPVPPDCASSMDTPSAGALLELLDIGPNPDPVTLAERQITVGTNPDRDVLYLADGHGTTVLRLTRATSDSPPTTPAPTSDTRPTDTRTGRESFDVVSAFGEISDEALAVTTDGRVAAAVGDRVSVRNSDGGIESVALPDGVTADQLWIGTDDIGVAWSETGGVEIDLAQLTIVSRLTRTNDVWARTEVAAGMTTAPVESGYFTNPLGLTLLVHEGTVVPEAEGAGCFAILHAGLGQSWLFGRPAACASWLDEIAPRTGGGYFLTMRGIGADNTDGLYLLELAPDEFDPHYASNVALPSVDTVIDAQPTSDGLTLLHRHGSTVTTSHVTSD
jgi:hypothetical protein